MRLDSVGNRNVETYLAGFIAGDGHLEPKTNRTVLGSGDQQYAELLGMLLESLGYHASRFYDVGGQQWKVAVRSEKLQDVLTGNYGIPRGAKSKSLPAPSIPKEELVFFVSGVFDAEGWYEMDKGRYIRIRLKMTSEKMTSFLHDTLRNMRYDAKYHKRTDGSAVVEINRQAEVKKFLKQFMLLHPKWTPLYEVLGEAEAPNPPGYTRPTLPSTTGHDSERRS